MAYQATFKRYELKYLLSKKEKEKVLEAMAAYMELDKYGRCTIRNIYLDTDNFRLIRRSLEKPVYKEKLRIRSYRRVEPQDTVFVELKKKYKSVVYKRRLVLSEKEVMESFRKETPLPLHSQIGDEIEYFREYYGHLYPAVFLSYEREAYFMKDGSDFRVTFDENILYRRENFSLGSPVYGTPLLEEGQTLMEIKTSGGIPLWMNRRENFSLGSPVYGTPLLEEGQTLMEIKTSGGIPLWMSQILTQCHIYKTSFSKYGLAYKNMIAEKIQGGIKYA